MNNSQYFKQAFGVSGEVLEFCAVVESGLNWQFMEIDRSAEYNQLKVLSAMQKNKLSDVHFAATTGYGYNDLGRDTLEKIYADVFQTEDALVRPQIVSGTHALTVALFGNLRYGDELLSPVGKPYDTLLGVIGVRKTRGSLMEHGVQYRQVDLLPGDKIDYSGIQSVVSPKTKLVTIQRSKGYSWRRSFSVAEIAELIGFIKSLNPNVICMVDNCYGEFVETKEPGEADLIVGSLIKNPGGGIAPVGGYIAGKEEFVENAAARMTSPGLGKEVGPTLGITPALAQGLFLAPQTVSAGLKGAVFAAAIFKKLGFPVLPDIDAPRADIVQAIELATAENVIAFCQGIQKSSPVDSFVTPEPSGMPGYDAEVIMAAGTFVQGSSIELSADSPLKPPYAVFMQGGLTWHHAKAGVIMALDGMYRRGLLTLN